MLYVPSIYHTVIPLVQQHKLQANFCLFLFMFPSHLMLKMYNCFHVLTWGCFSTGKGVFGCHISLFNVFFA